MNKGLLILGGITLLVIGFATLKKKEVAQPQVAEEGGEEGVVFFVANKDLNKYKDVLN
jgi:uncharacterized protein YneR